MLPVSGNKRQGRRCLKLPRRGGVSGQRTSAHVPGWEALKSLLNSETRPVGETKHRSQKFFSFSPWLGEEIPTGLVKGPQEG